MRYLLILLVAVTMACGAAASVTISLAPAFVADNGEGYWAPWRSRFNRALSPGERADRTRAEQSD